MGIPSESEPSVTAFPHLFSPVRVGSVTVKNRIVSSGHDTVMAEDGAIGDRLIAYHEARAAGGVGLIVVQVAGVHETAKYTYQRADGRHRRRASTATDGSSRRCTPHDAVVFGQLFHDGREIMESQDGSLPVSLAPSAVPNERFHVMPRAMPVSLIDEIVAASGVPRGRLRVRRPRRRRGRRVPRLPARAVPEPSGQRARRRVRRARTRTGCASCGEVIACDRGQRSGPTSSSDCGSRRRRRSERAWTPTRCWTPCALWTPTARSTTSASWPGTSATLSGSDHIVPPMSFAAAYTRTDGQRVKDAVSVPVMVAGRINQPHEGEQVLANGQADAGGDDPCDDLRPGDAGEGRSRGWSRRSAPASAATRPASATSTPATRSRASSTPRPDAS